MSFSPKMKEHDIQQFITQTEKDLQLAKDFLAMWQRRNGQPSPSATMQPAAIQPALIPQQAPVKQGDYGATKGAVLKAIEKCPERYTIYDVQKALTEIGSFLPKPAISQAISRLYRQKVITLDQPGIGRKPAVYRKQ